MLELRQGLFLNKKTNELIIHIGKEVRYLKLEHQIFQILLMLAQEKGALVEKQLFIQKIWGGNELVGKEGLTKNIYKLRSFLRDHQLEKYLIVETIPKKGYRLKITESSIPQRDPKKLISSALLTLTCIMLLLMVFNLSRNQSKQEQKVPVFIFDENSDTIIHLGRDKVKVIPVDTSKSFISLDDLK